MQKEFRLTLSLRLVEIPRLADTPEERAAGEPARPVDPVDRDRDEMTVVPKQMMSMLGKYFDRASDGPPIPPASCSILQTFDIAAESFEEAQAKLNEFQELAHRLGFPSRRGEGGSGPFYVAGAAG